jgi:c-di-GMP-related signal transduction protein
LVAVDDAGAGYSSLQAIAELHPDYIKLDMSLIHGIDSNPTKKALLETFVTFAGKINSSLIAEGIETASELQEIKKLGISLGQGFFLAKPSTESPHPEFAFTRLLNSAESLTNKELSSIITNVPSISANTRINDILDYFTNNTSAPAVIVVDKSVPTGVVGEKSFYSS